MILKLFSEHLSADGKVMTSLTQGFWHRVYSFVCLVVFHCKVMIMWHTLHTVALCKLLFSVTFHMHRWRNVLHISCALVMGLSWDIFLKRFYIMTLLYVGLAKTSNQMGSHTSELVMLPLYIWSKWAYVMYVLSLLPQSVDYKGMSVNPAFERYCELAIQLQRVELLSLSREEKLAFFINIYNALVIHGYLRMGAPTNMWQRYRVRYWYFYNRILIIAYMILHPDWNKKIKHMHTKWHKWSYLKFCIFTSTVPFCSSSTTWATWLEEKCSHYRTLKTVFWEGTEKASHSFWGPSPKQTRDYKYSDVLLNHSWTFHWFTNSFMWNN